MHTASSSPDRAARAAVPARRRRPHRTSDAHARRNRRAPAAIADRRPFSPRATQSRRGSARRRRTPRPASPGRPASRAPGSRDRSAAESPCRTRCFSRTSARASRARSDRIRRWRLRARARNDESPSSGCRRPGSRHVHPGCFPTARRTPCRARGWPPGWTARSSGRRRRPPSPLAPCSASDTARRAAPEFRPQSDPVPSLACTRRSRRSRPRFPRSDGRAGTARMRRRFSRTPAAWESRAADRVPRPAFRRARRPRRKSRPRTPQ